MKNPFIKIRQRIHRFIRESKPNAPKIKFGVRGRDPFIQKDFDRETHTKNNFDKTTLLLIVFMLLASCEKPCPTYEITGTIEFIAGDKTGQIQTLIPEYEMICETPPDSSVETRGCGDDMFIVRKNYTQWK